MWTDVGGMSMCWKTGAKQGVRQDMDHLKDLRAISIARKGRTVLEHEGVVGLGVVSRDPNVLVHVESNDVLWGREKVDGSQIVYN